MAVTTTHAVREYTSTGVEVDLIVDFQFLAAEHLIVTKGPTGVETTLVLGVDYTVDALVPPLPATSTVRLTAPATAGHKVRIARSTPRDQTTILSKSGALDPVAVMAMVDKRALIEQELTDGVSIGGSFIHGNLGGGALHATATGATAGFYHPTDKTNNDNHRASTANPHATTYAQVGAAPIGHVGSSSLVDGHPLATAAVDGFYPKEHFAKVESMPPEFDARNFWIDDFWGPILDTARWARSTGGTAPTASVQALEFGVYRELTAAAATSLVLLRSTALGPSRQRTPNWYARLALGAQGSADSNCQARWGWSANPGLAHGADANIAYFWWDGVDLWTVTKDTVNEQAIRVTPKPWGSSYDFHVYRIEMNNAGEVKFYVDGLVVATHTLYPPVATTPLERYFEISNVSAIQRSLDIDYCKADWKRPAV